MLNYFRLKSLVQTNGASLVHRDIMFHLGFRVLVQRRPPSHPLIVHTQGLKSEITLWSVTRAFHLEALAFEQRTAPLARDMSVIAFCCFRWVFNAYNMYTHIIVIYYIRPQCVCAPETVHRRLWPDDYIIIIYYLYYLGKIKLLILATISRSNVYTHINYIIYTYII